MAVNINLSPEMERRLEEEAARRGQDAEGFARSVLEEKLASLPSEGHRPIEALFADLPRAMSEEIQAFLQAQGAKPVERFSDLLGDFWPEDESVDDFLEARRRWQLEGGSGFPWDQPEEIAKWSPDE
jgi:hypothetical protein